MKRQRDQDKQENEINERMNVLNEWNAEVIDVM